MNVTRNTGIGPPQKGICESTNMRHHQFKVSNSFSNSPSLHPNCHVALQCECIQHYTLAFSNMIVPYQMAMRT